MRIREFDYSVDVAQALLWQYNTAERLEKLMLFKQEWYELYNSSFFETWFEGIFDLATCGQNGLIVWAIILNVDVFITDDPIPEGYPAWGFANYSYNFYGNPAAPVGANFAPSQGNTPQLGLEDGRKLLQLRYFAITSNCSVTEINRMLAYVFGAGAGYVLDNWDMTMTYHFDIPPSQDLIDALVALDVLPRPAGVDLIITT